MATTRSQATWIAFVFAAFAVGIGWFVLARVENEDPRLTNLGEELRNASSSDSNLDAEVPIDPLSAVDPKSVSVVARHAASDEELERVHGRVLDANGKAVAEAMVGEITSMAPALSDSEGCFEFGIESGSLSFQVLVIAAEHAPHRYEFVRQDRSRSHDLGIVHLTPGASVHGRVLNAAKEPIANAEVHLQPAAGLEWLLALDYAALIPPTSCAGDGSYSLGCLAAGNYQLHVAAPGYLATQTSVVVEQGDDVEVPTISLAAAYSVAGQVIDADSRAVQGARLRVGVGSLPGRELATATSDAEGRFVIGGLPGRKLWIEAHKAGFARAFLPEFDPSKSAEVILKLEAGLRIQGLVVDAESKAPIESFAFSVRCTDAIGVPRLTAAPDLLAQRLERLRMEIALVEESEERQRAVQLERELALRLHALRSKAAQPLAVNRLVTAPETRPGGRFLAEGLQSGRYRIAIDAPGYAPYETEEFGLTRANTFDEHFIELRKVPQLTGRVVTKREGVPVAGAVVELERCVEVDAESQGIQRSLYGWIFAPSKSRSIAIAKVQTDADGRFEIDVAEHGRALLSVRGPSLADFETEAFDLAQVREELQLTVGERAQLQGKVLALEGRVSGDAEVVLIGGGGTMQTCKLLPDLSYHFEQLQPGSYLVRAFPSSSRVHFNRFFSTLFPLHAGAVDPTQVPQPDVILAEGESAHLDLKMELPASGSIEGAVTLNGQPALGLRASLRPIDAPSAGGLSIEGNIDERGRYGLHEVPVGRYRIEFSSATRQVLAADEVQIEEQTTAQLDRDLHAGGVRGRIVAADPADLVELRGTLWILPGATVLPADLHAYRKQSRTHRLRLRQAQFEELLLTPGVALCVLECVGWNPIVTAVEIPSGGCAELMLYLPSRERR